MKTRSKIKSDLMRLNEYFKLRNLHPDFLGVLVMAVLHEKKDNMNLHDLAQATGYCEAHVLKAIRTLKRGKSDNLSLIQYPARGLYRLSPEGKGFMDEIFGI